MDSGLKARPDCSLFDHQLGMNYEVAATHPGPVASASQKSADRVRSTPKINGVIVDLLGCI